MSRTWPDDCPSPAADPVPVVAGSATAGIDFTLDRLGSIGGTLLVADTGQGVRGEVQLYDSAGSWVAYDTTWDGSYLFEGLEPDDYFVYGRDDYWPMRHIPVLYEDVPCPGSVGDGCDLADGTPVPVTLNSTTTGIDLRLGLRGAISGRIFDADSGTPLPGVRVEVWDADGVRVSASESSDTVGRYEVDRLYPGVYYVSSDAGATSGRVDVLYDGIPCWGGAPDGCDPTKGTPVTVVSGQTVRYVDMSLAGDSPGIQGTVVDGSSGLPLPGVVIDVWDAVDSTYEEAAFTDGDGRYRVPVDEGPYLLATDNAAGFTNQIYDGIPCPGGSAYNGDCDPASGQTVVVANGSTTSGIDFVLWRPAVFADGFESGDLSAWVTVP